MFQTQEKCPKAINAFYHDMMEKIIWSNIKKKLYGPIIWSYKPFSLFVVQLTRFSYIL